MAQDSGGYFTRPVIGADDSIYFGTLAGCFYALQPDKTLKWRVHVGASILSNPVLGHDGTIYFGANDGKLYALDPDDGTEVWARAHKSRIEAGPAVAPDGRIYVGTMGGELLAYSKDGVQQWSLLMDEGSRSIKFTPIVDEVDGQRFVVFGTEGPPRKNLGLVRVLDSGSRGTIVATRFEHEQFRIGGEVWDDVLYTSSCDKIFAVSLDLQTEYWRQDFAEHSTEQSVRIHRNHPVLSPDGKTLYQGMRSDDHLYALRASDGGVRWRVDIGRNVVMTAAVNPCTGIIYVGQAAGGPFLFAIDPDGTVKWKQALGVLRCTPAVSEDGSVVYTGDKVGNFYAVDAETGEKDVDVSRHHKELRGEGRGVSGSGDRAEEEPARRSRATRRTAARARG